MPGSWSSSAASSVVKVGAQRAASQTDGAALRMLKPGERYYYKAVATVDGGAYSIFDGRTRYKLGVAVHTPIDMQARGHRCGGTYVYASASGVVNLLLPANCALANAPRAVMRVIGWGGTKVHGGGKIAVEHILPVSFFPYPAPRIDSRPVCRSHRLNGLLATNMTLAQEVREMEEALGGMVSSRAAPAQVGWAARAVARVGEEQRAEHDAYDDARAGAADVLESDASVLRRAVARA